MLRTVLLEPGCLAYLSSHFILGKVSMAREQEIWEVKITESFALYTQRWDMSKRWRRHQAPQSAFCVDADFLFTCILAKA